MRDSAGRTYHLLGKDALQKQTVRLIEKTPKNVLRIPFIEALFPDALYIYLYRDPLENISSIMEGWRSRRFVTYTDKVGPNGNWSFLLPPGWGKRIDKPLEEIAAWQWSSSHRFAMRDLAGIPRDRWMGLHYTEFLEDTEQTVDRLCQFMGFPMDDSLRARCAGTLPHSRYTLTEPAREKWQKNAHRLGRILPTLEKLVAEVNSFAGRDTTPMQLVSRIDREVVKSSRRAEEKLNKAERAKRSANSGSGGRVGRNDPCPCGSGKKYKACHGRI
jgi:hypothetical protein